MAAQDAHELFDLCSADGAPLGRQKERALVHRDGDWHRSLHIWVVIKGEDGSPHVLLQRRSAEKDTWPGALDVAVAGHYRAGEALEQGLREAEEEIGLALELKDVVRIGLRRRADQRPGVQDNELQDIFVALTAKRLGDLVPFADEVEALIALPLEDAAKLLSGEAAEARGIELLADTKNINNAKAPSGREVGPVIARARDLIPAEDGYYARAMRSILDLIEGRAPAPWTLG